MAVEELAESARRAEEKLVWPCKRRGSSHRIILVKGVSTEHSTIRGDRGRGQVVKCHLTTNTMVKITIPNPKENGCYSKVVQERHEKIFNTSILQALSQEGFTESVELKDAGHVLDILRKEAIDVTVPGLPPWPVDTLPDLDACNEYVKQIDDVCDVLREVYEKRAYIWLIEQGTSDSLFGILWLTAQ